MVTSPHHLSATMVTERTHRMTELFGRLAPGVTIEQAREELTALHAAVVRAHPESYSATANMQLRVARLRDQIAAPARTILLVLLAAAGLVFVIACSNVANLILARSVRREGELAVRAALGASAGALRRTLLAESVVLCGAGAMLGVLLARPMVGLVGRYAARFSGRALDVPVDATLLWVGAGLAMAAAVALAFVPRLPSPHAPIEHREPPPWFRPRRQRVSRQRRGSNPALLAASTVRITPGINRRLRIFAVAQVALSFVLLAGAGMLLSALITLQRANTGYDLRHVLAIDVPMPIESFGVRSIAFVEEATRRISALGGVEQVAAGNVVPWRDAGLVGPGFQFTVEGYTPKDNEEQPYARLRNVSPGFFAALGIPIVSGRDFTGDDRSGTERVVLVSQSIAEQFFPAGDALNHRLWWTDPYFGKPEPRRIVGIVANVDDERIAPGKALTIYHPFLQMPYAGRLFVYSRSDPHRLAAPIARIIREMSPDQPVERAATLEDVRSDLLGPERLNAFVFSGFAGIALLIAVVGVAGVLAFAVSARTREFGVRLAVGSSPWQVLAGVLAEGILIVTMGVAAGGGAGYVLGRVAAGALDAGRLPGAATVLGAAAIMVGAAIAAATMPAARASRVDVLQALRSE
jgi:predicted permease